MDNMQLGGRRKLDYEHQLKTKELRFDDFILSCLL